MNKESLFFFRMINEYLTEYLPKQKGASEHTLRSYKAALNQFLDFICKQGNIKLQNVHFGIINRQLTEKYLDHLEDNCGYAVSSRNQRLAVIKGFLKYSGVRELTVMACYHDISIIPIKKAETHIIEFFSEKALEVILLAADTSKKIGRRDRMFMIFLYDTGARLWEILNVKLKDLHIDKHNAAGKSYVTVLGKGEKYRSIPLMPKTVEHLNQYIKAFHDGTEEAYLFYVRHDGKKCRLSEDSAEKFIKKYGIKAKSQCDEVPENLYPHMFRHSRAMHLYRNGMSLPLISEWLGHAQIETTINYYANADLKMKREAIEKATSDLNPLLSSKVDIDIEYDEDTIRKLYGLA